MSKKESMRIAALLGGEIGIEKEDKAQSEQYARLCAQSRRRTDVSRSPVKKKHPGGAFPSPKEGGATDGSHRIDLARGARAEGRGPRGGTAVSAAAAQKKPSYWDRVRINFLAAHRDHRIMTLGGAIFSLLPSQRKQERVNPAFIKTGRSYLLAPLKVVCHGSNVLLKGGNRRGGLYRPHPFYEEVMEVLADWQVETIGGEMERLEANLRNSLIEQCTPLCQALYSPMVRLLALEGLPLESAVRHYHKLIALHNSENPTKAAVKEAGKEVLDNLPPLFHHLRYSCYPLLLKLTGSTFSRREEFFVNHRDEYLAFLNLREEDVLKIPAPLPPVSPKDLFDAPPMPTAGREEKKEIPRKFVEALLVLQEMFPQAGFENLRAFPDLLPYFSPFIPFLKNFALISPRDPLHSIVVIMGILRELFFAFGGVKMGILKNDEWDLKDLRGTFEGYTLQWVRHLENYLPKQILLPLKEYCREQERRDKKDFTYGYRIESNIFHRKKIFYLPHLEVPLSTFPCPPLMGGQQKLWHLADDLTNLLSSMYDDIYQAEGSIAVINGEDPILFEVENFVSKRFRIVMKRRGLPFTNATLIDQTAALTGILSEFLNNPDSFYYRAPLTPIYRTAEGDSTTPQYAVNTLNAEKLIAESDRELAAGKKPETANRNEGYQAEALIPSLEQALEGLRLQKIGSALILVTAELPEDGEKLQALLEEELRTDDLWYHHSGGGCAVLLRETSGEEAVMLIHRLQKHRGVPSESGSTSVGIVPLKEEWSPKEVISQAEKALAESQRRKGQFIILFDVEKNRHRAFAPVHK